MENILKCIVMFITPLSDSFSVCFYVSAKKHLQVQFLKAFCGHPDLACFVTINYNKKKQKLISVFSNFNMSCFCESPFCKMFWRPPEVGGGLQSCDRLGILRVWLNLKSFNIANKDKRMMIAIQSI